MPSCLGEGNLSSLLEPLADWIIKLTQDRLIAKNKFNIICTGAPEKNIKLQSSQEIKAYIFQPELRRRG